MPNAAMKQSIDSLLNAGPADLTPELREKFLLFNAIVFCYIVIAVPFIVMHLIRGNHFLFSVLTTGLIFILALKQILARTKKPQIIFSITAVIISIVFLSNFLTGGVKNCGPLWYFAFPMATLIMLGLKTGTFFSVSLISVSALMLVPPFNKIMTTVYDPDFLIRFFIAYAIVFALAFIYEYQKEKNRREIKELAGLLPICSSCKKIRDDKGYWNQIESFIQERSQAEFSHGICPECSERLYGHEEWYKDQKKNNSS